MGRIARKLEEKEKAEKIERSKKQLLALIAELKLIIQRYQQTKNAGDNATFFLNYLFALLLLTKSYARD